MRTVLVSSLLTILIFVCYRNVFQNPFVGDDYRTIVDNGSIVSLRHLTEIARHTGVSPVVNFSLALNWSLWRTVPYGYHFMGLLMHVLNVFLLHGLASSLAQEQCERSSVANRWIDVSTVAMVATGLFALHPLMTTAVGYTSARSELMLTTAILLAVITARLWMDTGLARWWIATFALWVIAMLTSAVAIIFPLLLVAHEVVRGREGRASRIATVHIPFMTMALLALIWRNTGSATAGMQLQWSGLADQVMVGWRYALLLVDPRKQAIYHAVQQAGGSSHLLVGLFALLVTLLAALLPVGSWALARFGALWFWICLLPYAALAIMGQGNEMAEQRLYLPSCGAFLIAGVLTSRILTAIPISAVWVRRVAHVDLVLILLFLGVLTYRRVAVWSDPHYLWNEAIQLAPRDPRPQVGLAEELHRRGRPEAAAVALERALALQPNDPASYVALAVYLAEAGRLEEAQTATERLRVASPDSPYVPIALGAVSVIAGRQDRAREYLMAALAKDPESVQAREWLARIAEQSEGGAAMALRLCEEMQQLAPGRRSIDECVRRNQERLARVR
jgi:tetratricopeptide (TPR) repeat protein